MDDDHRNSHDAAPRDEQVSCRTGVTLAGAGPLAADDLARAKAVAPCLIAADGGADALDRLGRIPQAIIGDMDSLRTTPDPATRILRVFEQNSTDFGKCLARIEAPFIVGVGFTGGRIDHMLAALHVLMLHAKRTILLLGEEDVLFATPRSWEMTMEAGDRVSFYPVMPCKGIASRGLRWPIDGLRFAAGKSIGTSNEATGGVVSASFDRPGAITILPKRYFERAMESLTTRPTQSSQPSSSSVSQ